MLQGALRLQPTAQTTMGAVADTPKFSTLALKNGNSLLLNGQEWPCPAPNHSGQYWAAKEGRQVAVFSGAACQAHMPWLLEAGAQPHLMLPQNKVKGLVPPTCVVNALCLIACKGASQAQCQQAVSAAGLVAAEQAECLTCSSTRPERLCLSQGCMPIEDACI